MFWTDCFELSRINVVQVIEGYIGNNLKGNETYFELAGGLIYRRFELPTVTEMAKIYNHSKCITEIQRKPLLV